MNSKTAFLLLVAVLVVVSLVMGEGGAISNMAHTDGAAAAKLQKSWSSEGMAPAEPPQQFAAAEEQGQSEVIVIDEPPVFEVPYEPMFEQPIHEVE